MDLQTVYSNFIKVISATFIDDEEEGEDGNSSNANNNSNIQVPTSEYNGTLN